MSNIVVPELGESVVEARIARWLKNEGDTVQAGEPLVALETEKVDIEVGSEQGGVLTRIARKEGDDVKVGELLGVVDDAPAGNGSRAPKASTEAGTVTRAEAPSAAAPAAAAETRATPAARRMAKDHDVRIEGVAGSGSAGRVMKQDVEKAVKPAAAPAPPSAGKPAAPAPAPQAARRPAGERREERTRMSKRRATIARRLVEAQQTAAMLTTFNEVDMTAVMELRGRRKEDFRKQHGVGLGVAAFFVKASIAALRAFPQVNGEIQGDEIVLKHYYDIGIAVGAEGGLVVPVLRDADQMSFAEIEQAIRDFAQRANDGSLTLEDLSGGTFTITNGGVFGSLLSTPILNPPQVGILGLHKIADRPVAIEGQVVIRPMMNVALTYDHRLIDGREAVQFLVKVKEYIEDPGHLLIEG